MIATVNKPQDKLDKLLEKYNLTETELKSIMKQKARPAPKLDSRIKLDLNSDSFYFGVISDTHFGHNKYRPDILEHASKRFKEEGVDFVCHSGDICEGMSGREGHLYELQPKYGLGASNQLDYATDQLSQIELPIYAITATASHDGWFHSKGNAGLEVGIELERRVNNFHWLGHDEADIVLDSGVMIRMLHPGGGTSYALSYKPQKYANSLSGGRKPNIVLEGHYHKSMYMFYRNMHMIEAATLEEQTVFMKKMGTPAMLGYWLIRGKGNKKGVTDIEPKFIPFYE